MGLCARLPHSIFSFEIIAFSASSDAVLPISSRLACSQYVHTCLSRAQSQWSSRAELLGRTAAEANRGEALCTNVGHIRHAPCAVAAQPHVQAHQILLVERLEHILAMDVPARCVASTCSLGRACAHARSARLSRPTRESHRKIVISLSSWRSSSSSELPCSGPHTVPRAQAQAREHDCPTEAVATEANRNKQTVRDIDVLSTGHGVGTAVGAVLPCFRHAASCR